MKSRLLRKLRKRYSFSYHPEWKFGRHSIVYFDKKHGDLNEVFGRRYSGPLHENPFDDFIRSIGFKRILKANREKFGKRKHLTIARRYLLQN